MKAHIDPRNFALAMIERFPNVANNDNAQHMIDVIKNNDAEEGMKIAENLCKSYGISKEDALKQACSVFNYKMQ